jgi:hypothetical protein
MIKFTLGAITSALVCVLLTKHPELVRQGIRAARQQIAVAARNLSAATASDRADPEQRASDDSTRIHPRRVKDLSTQMADMSRDELWAVMNDSDFDRRAAAGRVLLSRAEIPASTQGIQVIKDRFFRSGRGDDLKTGFSYVGLLATQRVPEDQIVMQAQQFVERYPRHEACDYAVWALGELGSEELVPYFFQIARDPQKYGPAARERAFCCLAQCGRYSPAQRIHMVPDLIDVYENARDGQTRTWSLQALAHCAPTTHARSIDDWKKWWSRQ